MPGLHVIGEIVGASGLRPREAFSLDHWLDLLSLHPSSKNSFFCRWKLVFRSFLSPSLQLKRDASWPEWRVLQGATQGQTQVHSWSPFTSLEETVTMSSQRPQATHHEQDDNNAEPASLVELETLWCHPIDLHLAIANPSPLPASWPYLEFELWSLNEFQLEHLVGTASIAVPLAQDEFFLDLPILKLSRPSVLGAFGLSDQHSVDSPGEDEAFGDNNDLVASSVGTMYVRLAIVQQGFIECGVFG